MLDCLKTTVHVTCIFYMSTVFTWLNAAATITLVSKIGAATIQSRPSFDTGKRFLSHYFHN